jgi:hypothetical protein
MPSICKETNNLQHLIDHFFLGIKSKHQLFYLVNSVKNLKGVERNLHREN